jgi:hypothetical protein
MADLGNPKSHPGEPAHSKGQNTAFQNSGVYLATRTIPHSEIRNPKFSPSVPQRPPRDAFLPHTFLSVLRAMITIDRMEVLIVK